MEACLRNPRPRSRNAFVRTARALWTLPTNVLGHTAGALVSASVGRRVASPYADARLYLIRTPALGWVGGVTLGHAILLAPRLTEGLRGRLILAHELAHTRQHEVLGPLYLPLHAAAQVASALLYAVRPDPTSDPVHAHNPLEERWLFLGHRAIEELCRGERWTSEARDALLESVGA